MADPSDTVPLNNGASPLAGALARVAAAVETVPKHGENRAQHYSFATFDDILGALSSHLEAEGISIRMGVDRSPGACVVEHDGKLERWRIRFRFVITHAPSGETAVDYWWASAFDSGDKGATKAATSAHKHFLRHMAMIATSDDDDPDAYSPSAERARTAQDADAERPPPAATAAGRAQPGPAWMSAIQHEALARHGWGSPRNPEGALTKLQRETLELRGIDPAGIASWAEAHHLLEDGS